MPTGGTSRSRHRAHPVRLTSGRAPRTAVGMREPLALTSAIQALPTSATLRLNELVAARTAAGQDTIHLGFGEARLPLLPALRQSLAVGAARAGYPPVAGLSELREAIAGYLRRTRSLDVAPEQVIAGPGSKALLFALLSVLEGDLLLPVPSWVSYAPQARLLGKRVIPVPTAEDDHLRLTSDALSGAWARARHAGADPRILIVNSPSNPTGGMFAAADVAAMAGWAREHGVAILSDELYAELAHGERPHHSPAREYPEATVVLGGISKAFSAGGWRLGYAAVPAGPAGKHLLSAVRAIASEIWSGASTPVQVAAARVYEGGAEVDTYLRQSARLHGHVAARLHSALVGWGITCPAPKGGFYLYPDFARWREQLAARGVSTGMDLARHLLTDWGVAALPASEFGEAADVLRLRLASSHLVDPDGAPNPDAREAVLWDLMAAADSFAEPGGSPLALPALERAITRLGEFVASLS
jgi:aspartate/methionine/tyrosine aminotransferase